jgi:hypothetical protein
MKALTPMKAIRAKCLDCSNASAHEVKNCPITECPLWELRFGKNPNRKGIGNSKRSQSNQKVNDNEEGLLVQESILSRQIVC